MRTTGPRWIGASGTGPARRLMWASLATACLAAGCSQGLRLRGAPVLSKTDLLQAIDEQPRSHFNYVGSDNEYHYLEHVTQREQRPFRVHRKELSLKNTFERGEEPPYVLSPWVLEGRSLGAKPDF